MPNSFIQGKTWYWRQGVRQRPLHCDDIIRTAELCFKVDSSVEGMPLLKELRKNGIHADIKTTHSGSKFIPAESIVVYADMNIDEEHKHEHINLENLKNYILSNGGIIGNEEPKIAPQKPLFQGLFGRLFGRGGK